MTLHSQTQTTSSEDIAELATSVLPDGQPPRPLPGRPTYNPKYVNDDRDLSTELAAVSIQESKTEAKPITLPRNGPPPQSPYPKPRPIPGRPTQRYDQTYIDNLAFLNPKERNKNAPRPRPRRTPGRPTHTLHSYPEEYKKLMTQLQYVATQSMYVDSKATSEDGDVIARTPVQVLQDIASMLQHPRPRPRPRPGRPTYTLADMDYDAVKVMGGTDGEAMRKHKGKKKSRFEIVGPRTW
jgi:hypothetical protein